MWAYVGRRLLLAIPTLLGASIIVFAMVHLAPGDPLSAVMPVDASQADIEAARRTYGFDQPLPLQYLRWLGRVVQGDLGKSIATRRPVLQDVSAALKNSLVLSAADTSWRTGRRVAMRSEEHTSELQSLAYLVCRLLLE